MITIQYGPWVPDVANIPFQMPDQEGPVQVPVADCLNVYYANGVYQSLSAPVSTSLPALAAQCLGAMTFNDPNGQPVPIFGCANGNAYYQSASNALATLFNQSGVLGGIGGWNLTQFGTQIFGQVLANRVSVLNPGNLIYSVPGGTVVTINGVPYGTVMGVVGQFVMVGDLAGQESTQNMGTGDGVNTHFSGSIPVSSYPTSIYVFNTGTGGGNGYDDGLGNITGTGIASGTINYDTGAVLVTFTTPPSNGGSVQVDYAPAYRARLAWSPIGNPSADWPTPLTNAAIAVQSGIQDLEYAYGPVMGISGYPLYGVIFQRAAITRAQYIGGNVVWSWQTFERNRGLLAKGAFVQVGANTYFLSDAGFFYTDGANVIPIGTAQDNSAGIDGWFFANVNKAALNAIRGGYDAQKRCVFFAIPTGSNTLPDTLLTFNPLSGRWTRSQVATEVVWTDTDGFTERLGIVNQSHQSQLLTGTPVNTSYLESVDMTFSDGLLRDTNGVRPNTAAASPIVTVGTRNTLAQAVTYNAGYAPDSFSAGFAPALMEGLYTRIRVAAVNAPNIHGATCDMTPAGEL